MSTVGCNIGDQMCWCQQRYFSALHPEIHWSSRTNPRVRVVTNRGFHRDKSDFQKTQILSRLPDRERHTSQCQGPSGRRLPSNQPVKISVPAEPVHVSSLHTSVYLYTFVSVYVSMCECVCICVSRYICIGRRPNLTPLLVRINWEKLEWAKETLMVDGRMEPQIHR